MLELEVARRGGPVTQKLLRLRVCREPGTGNAAAWLSTLRNDADRAGSTTIEHRGSCPHDVQQAAVSELASHSVVV